MPDKLTEALALAGQAGLRAANNSSVPAEVAEEMSRNPPAGSELGAHRGTRKSERLQARLPGASSLLGENGLSVLRAGQTLGRGKVQREEAVPEGTDG